ncbi:MAG: hypothetical protein N2578_06130 [Bdellovibrionaceae bacterium]|nr:hypothetical protein [Pseudobdellovibrionaceae bacterium]
MNWIWKIFFPSWEFFAEASAPPRIRYRKGPAEPWFTLENTTHREARNLVHNPWTNFLMWMDSLAEREDHGRLRQATKGYLKWLGQLGPAEDIEIATLENEVP